MITYLLDTNIVIYVIKRRPVEVLGVFNSNATRMAISVITLAELMHGAEKSSKPAENLAVVEDFCSRLSMLPYTEKAAQHYGQIRTALEKKGEPIGVNDLHIAAHARSEGLILVTNNEKEFAKVPSLQIENWVTNL
ncbi:type II toxin-antitoxin system tRNA(fMet)-specific endonuclease VapC [Methylophilus medardicus]|uniref:Ribonuclease VapC n=1 Tax=Methylophilus medardicus TaxID=2588534 RepID=A0A5B8CPP6_9PROT|nr:type II toxin-antitoxin system VapC family toxin [Methylophilus medardicus]QDC43211.1 type II toxin-antitoxin system VapC family toxin [Methylophilus medardicus]QDC48218.1 type II toxin-antitoxin system VapC family toxin [Methylophilus medardicus]QDC51923.1 type II toxin-antitoxin system VapC family toxin [Methylophilus medardicus]